MRQISISVATYAAIWSARQPGENSEEAILRRTFGVPVEVEQRSYGHVEATSGYTDPRFGVHLPEGFEVFRTHRGKHYRAKVAGGALQLANDGKQYRSFNGLSSAIGTKTENAWRSWYYTAPDGRPHLILELRKERSGRSQDPPAAANTRGLAAGQS
jgi:hypothetical protein